MRCGVLTDVLDNNMKTTMIAIELRPPMMRTLRYIRLAKSKETRIIQTTLIQIDAITIYSILHANSEPFLHKRSLHGIHTHKCCDTHAYTFNRYRGTYTWVVCSLRCRILK